jgi:ATP-dependent helicase HrpA
VVSGATFERWYREASRDNPKLLMLSREELMRHEAAGITTSAFPRTVRLGGVDCAASYLHQPGDPADGVTVTVPIYALNQVSEERCEWLVPGMLEDKVMALVKSLHQRPRSRLVPLPEFVAEFCATAPFAQGALVDVLLKAVRERTQLAIQRNDFKLEQLPPHLFMNFRVVDEHGRQLGLGRSWPPSRPSWAGRRARPSRPWPRSSCRPRRAAPQPQMIRTPSGGRPRWRWSRRAARAGRHPVQQHTAWTFGELPELMEIRKAGQTLIGFPALIDKGAHVEIEVFDEPDVAAAKHRGGLRRLVALQIREPLKYLEKNIPDLTKMAVAYMPLGTAEELKAQIIDVALDKAFLADPLPQDKLAFERASRKGAAA